MSYKARVSAKTDRKGQTVPETQGVGVRNTYLSRRFTSLKDALHLWRVLNLSWGAHVLSLLGLS